MESTALGVPALSEDRLGHHSCCDAAAVRAGQHDKAGISGRRCTAGVLVWRTPEEQSRMRCRSVRTSAPWPVPRFWKRFPAAEAQVVEGPLFGVQEPAGSTPARRTPRPVSGGACSAVALSHNVSTTIPPNRALHGEVLPAVWALGRGTRNAPHSKENTR